MREFEMQVGEPLNACSLAARVAACESGLGAAVEGLHGQIRVL